MGIGIAGLVRMMPPGHARVLTLIWLRAFVDDDNELMDVVGGEDPDEVAGLYYSNEIGWHGILPAPVRSPQRYHKTKRSAGHA
jgi:hypothetical protein